MRHSAPPGYRLRLRRATPRPTLWGLVQDAICVWTVIVLPKWWAVVMVIGLLIGDHIADRLIHWQREHIDSLKRVMNTGVRRG